MGFSSTYLFFSYFFDILSFTTKQPFILDTLYLFTTNMAFFVDNVDKFVYNLIKSQFEPVFFVDKLELST